MFVLTININYMKKEIVKKEWIEMRSPTRTYILGDEPELIHVIKTGFKDRYMVVWEDAYELNIGKVEYHTSNSLEVTYGIKINDDFLFKFTIPDWLPREKLREIIEISKTKKLKAVKMLSDIAKENDIKNSLNWSLKLFRKMGIVADATEE